MIPEYRRWFNAAFAEDRYGALVNDLNTSVKYPMDFHLCETPLFLPPALRDQLIHASRELCAIVDTSAYQRQAESAIPLGLRVPNETPYADFLQVDFALCTDPSEAATEGAVVPRLIELQGFPTLFGFQWLLDLKLRKYFEIGDDLHFYLGGHTESSYTRLLRQVIVKDHLPENVILLEIRPEEQKTRIDFAATEKLLGIPTVCLTEVIKRGRRLFYRNSSGREVPIQRIYNRVIFDELARYPAAKDASYQLTDEVEVEWVSHPNWFFKISKYSLPLLDHPTVPPARFLSTLERYPDDLEQYILKPLYSYSGMGVELDVTPARLDAIPPKQRGEYLLQRKIRYAPLVETPDEKAKVEVRVMLIRPDQAHPPEPVATLVRMSKGPMMGTRFNKDRTWVGSTLAYAPFS